MGSGARLPIEPGRSPSDKGGITSAASSTEQRALVRAARMALGAWPSFAALDVYMGLVLFPASRLWLVLTYRLLGELVNLAAYEIVRRRYTDPRPARIAHLVSYASMGLLISLMSLELGGLHSRYVHGVSIVVMVRAIVVPARALRSIWWSLPIMLAFPFVHLVAWRLGVPESAMSPHRLAVFVSDYVFLVGSTVVGAAAGHLIWTAEEQLFRTRRLGRYRLEAPIGKGGMGEIWLASDESLHRRVALKILREDRALDEGAIQRFEREAKAASQLTNPHTIEIFDYGATDDGLRFIVMEYLVGSDLAGLVEAHGPLEVGRVLHFARQACVSLADAHASGIVHRDIKPQNLFVTRVGGTFDWLKLLDFGIARRLEDAGESATSLTRPGAIPGTPGYVAPELWTGGQADARCDIYALGATLFYLLTGRTPTADDGHDERFVSRARGGVIPVELERIVARCLERDPVRRYADVPALEADLAACPVPKPWTPDDARTFWTLTHPRQRDHWAADTIA